MTDRVIDVLRVKFTRPNGRENVSTVPVRHIYLEVNDPRPRQGRRPIAELRVHRMSKTVVLEPGVDGVHLRKVNLQDGGSYPLKTGDSFWYNGYTWTMEFVHMSHLTRALNRQCNGLVQRQDGSFDIGVTLPGGCYLRTLPPASPPDLEILPLWVPGRRTTETDEVQRLLFSQPIHRSPSYNPTVMATYLYSPRRDLTSAFRILPEGITGLDLIVVSITQAHILRDYITQISKLDSVTSLTLTYDTFCAALVEVPNNRQPTGHLQELTCDNVCDIFIYDVMRSLIQFNPHLRQIDFGGRRDYVVNLIQNLRARVHLTSLHLELQNLEDDVSILEMIQFPSFQLTELEIILSRVADAGALRRVIQQQRATLQTICITEQTPDALHVCNQHCPMNIIPEEMPVLNKVILSNLTCAAPTLAAILALNKEINVIMHLRLADRFDIRGFVGLRPSIRTPSVITELSVSPGCIMAPLLFNSGLWDNLNHVVVTQVLLRDVPNCLKMASRVETLHLMTLTPTAADCLDLKRRFHLYELTVADLFLAGTDETASITNCARLRSLTLNIGMPARAIWNVPTVGQSLFFNGLQNIPDIRFFACDWVSSRLCVLLDEYSMTHPGFTFRCSLHDSYFGDL